MKKILFLLFLQIPTGHQQTAISLMEHLHGLDPSVEFQKIDLMSYAYGRLEKAVSGIYLQWIRTFPHMYSRIYQSMVYSGKDKKRDWYFYEIFFIRSIRSLTEEFKPDAIVCTHALPSLLLSKLKRSERLKTPVFNVYTDYFIHEGWGIHGVDGHFVSTPEMESYLLSLGVPKNSIFRTGIPVHPSIKWRPIIPEKIKGKAHILVSGGSMGTGRMEELLKRFSRRDDVHVFVLCGKNRKLYEWLNRKGDPFITPIGYIRSRTAMDALYNLADLIITKPGGVTVAECLRKKVPIFIYHTLPGQEEINLHHLIKHRLVLNFSDWNFFYDPAEQLLDFLHSPGLLTDYYSSLYNYEQSLLPHSPPEIILQWL